MSMIDTFIKKDDIDKAAAALEAAEKERRERIRAAIAIHLGQEPNAEMVDDVFSASSQAESISLAGAATGGILSEILNRVSQSLKEVGAR